MIYDDLPDRSPLQRCWQGYVAETVTDFADPMEIIIPDLSSNTKVDGVMWQSRNNIDLPQKGDKCLAVLDNNNEWWVVSWWPF